MLIDKYGRKIDYLRISVTDRCNLRCIYCMPECGIINKPQQELLTFEEIVDIVKAAVKLGVDKIRLTGGEPLVRENLAELIYLVNNIKGVKDISMTTNGVLLKGYASELRRTGLKRINVSLDSLNRARYKFITRGGDLERVWQGIQEALRIGFSLLKINVLLLEDTSISEIRDFLMLTLDNPVCVRFLEFMPLNSFYRPEIFVSALVVLEIAKRLGDIEESRILGSGPAKSYRFKHALGSFGVISPMSNKFCGSCNRLRLTSDGFLKSCLHSEPKVNLRDPLRKGANEEELIELIKLAVYTKHREHSLDKDTIATVQYSMCQIGG